MKDFKDTLFMPDTAFDMKANLPDKEPLYRQRWEDQKIYEKSLEQNKNLPVFVLHDGPPYANGPLHVGHALNKILKDFVVRYKTMQGFYSPYVAGWDTHGLPIENKMLEIMKMTKDDLDKVTLRKEAAKYALSQIESQKQQFKMMSLFTDFAQTYNTMAHSFEAAQLKLFKKMYFDGLVYKGLKPVFWSPTSQSALAEAEVEYEDVSSPQIFVTFKAIESNGLGDDLFLVIMTTTPWTLPANAAISVGEDILYDIVEANGQKYVIASKLVESVKALAKWNEIKILKSVYGRDLKGVVYEHPLNQKQYRVVLGDHVTTDTGSGLVHSAPLFGEEDFITGKQYGLDMVMHVMDDGKLTDAAGEFAGMFYLDANKFIGQRLEKSGNLLSFSFIKHSYPHDWRTHKPVIYRGTPQWFVSIDPIRETILEKLSKVASFPDWGTQRLAKMIEGRTEWTISRQRTWGVPIIIFYDEKKNEVKDEKVFDHVIDLVEKHGTDIWFEKTADELLPEEYRNRGYTKEEDIMDVWFDSGSTSIAVKPYGLEAPFDMYLEGADQFRGWFNSSLINSIAYRNEAPFKFLLSHGFVLDGKLQKMSKSRGNVVDPLEIIKKSGADILRLWIANSEYSSDISISDKILAQTADIYRNIRTKLRFVLGNLKGWDESMKVSKLTGFHALIDEKLRNLKFDVHKLLEEYKFAYALKAISNFITDVSAEYFNFTKDTLYVDEFDNEKRMQVLTNFYNIAEFLILVLAPILPTTMEEAYENLPKQVKKDSVHLEYINFSDASNSKTVMKEWAFFYPFKDAVFKVIEEAKQAQTVGRSQEVHFNVTKGWLEKVMTEANTSFSLNGKHRELAEILMLGKLTFDEALPEGIQVWKSEKCQRCWLHYDANKLNEDHICGRCAKVVAKAK